VGHCGQSLAGRLLWAVTLTNIWGGWTESRAAWNKKARQIVWRLRDIEERLAFDIEAFDTDNSGEFLNDRLLRHFDDQADHVANRKPKADVMSSGWPPQKTCVGPMKKR